MFTKVELLDAIDELQGGRHSVQNCEKLAAIYTVLDHLYPDDKSSARETNFHNQYSGDNKAYGNSEFLIAVAEKPQADIWQIIDELMDAIKVLNPKLYNSVMNQINKVGA